ncbi:enoyl-CoA hydratase/isomerase family protein [methanotrophic endosymbiont of Bathymodiolus puteoserpentis (Logatchev)]|jgi:2-(1,2-epoxy-1,2-dihydrophenyl)acetyl-CoA isomerase|uniref:enoyl-CoA hydratase/isomerase family protein n=1 Tax=methanotrophic endosymbiont of Bathymodiolus puteoserpentis (Logatchev) TaxID=343235 RepID=UPI0013C657FF|nr:enoyl-CoA hydratase/isomerase family protein [methanotrophic endosymbiont of Bathymodiolus puteoserpentis (Logatchev)]SHE21415.1 Enoyl-CoA hydratase [methanotrophic endosymbiont of Bathymodiolus puteoserpentis (Logatchev)]
MSLKLIKGFSDSDMSIDIEGAVVIFRLKSNAFNLMTDIDKKERYQKLFSVIEETPEIKVILSIFAAGALDENSYAQYISHLCGEQLALRDLDSNWDFKQRLPRLRQMVFHQDTIKQRSASKKIIIDCLQGGVVTPFFGETLSADFRFATEHMHFKLAHRQYGLHPSGGLAFFLPRYVGESKAIDILLNIDTITAKEALELGIINRIVSTNNFELECIQLAKKMCQSSITVIATTKQLTCRFKDELEDYFNSETKMMRIG